MSRNVYRLEDSGDGVHRVSSPAGKNGTRSALFGALAIILIVAIAVGLWYFLSAVEKDATETTPAVSESLLQSSDEADTEAKQSEPATESSPEPAIAPETVAPSAQASVAPAAVDLTAYAAQVLQFVNEERRKAGVSPLLLQGNSNYVNAAQTRAREIASTYSNSRPNGSSFETVLADNGIVYKAFTENIAKQIATPAELVKRLMSYSTTRNNILSSKFGKLAVGVYSDGSANDFYWNLLFTD